MTLAVDVKSYPCCGMTHRKSSFWFLYVASAPASPREMIDQCLCREIVVTDSNESSWEFVMIIGWFHGKRGCLNGSPVGFPEILLLCLPPLSSLSYPLLPSPSFLILFPFPPFLKGKYSLVIQHPPSWTPPPWIMPTRKKSTVTPFSNLGECYELSKQEGKGEVK